MDAGPDAGSDAGKDDDPLRALALRAAAGDHAAFAAIVDRFGGRVRAAALRMTAGRTDRADDLVQEAFVHLWTALPRWDPSRPFTPWLLQVAMNRCRNVLRGERRRPASSLDALAEEVDFEPRAGGERPDAAAARRDAASVLRAARDRLPETHRTILAMHYEAGMSHEQISAALGGMPIGTIKAKLHRARAALAAELPDELGEDLP